MSSLKGRRVLMIQQRNWGIDIGHFLAKKLQEEGAELAAITYKKSAHDFHRTQQDISYRYLISNDEVLENPERVLHGRKYSLEEITHALGVESIWPLVAASRDISRSYGEGFYYYPKRQQMSDDEIVRYIQGVYAYLLELFERFQPEIIVAPLFSELSHLMAYHLGKKRGVAAVCATETKIRGIWTTASTPWRDGGPFNERIDELNAGASSKNAERAAAYIREFRATFRKPDYIERRMQTPPLVRRIRSEFAPLRRIFEWYTGLKADRVAPLGATLDYRPPRIILRDHILRRWFAYQSRRRKYVAASRLGRYAYYPLQVEPEVTLDVYAPYFSNQVELARIIAMSLPGDYTLAVKDHPAMIGLRHPDVLEDIARLPNVKLIDPSIPGEQLLKGASLVLAPNSTALAEAAFYNIPAIQFGNEGTGLRLPNLIRHTDPAGLSGAIRRQLSLDLKTDEYEKRLCNYVSGAFDVGFEVDYIGAWEEGRVEERQKIWDLYRAGIVHGLS